MRRGTVATRWRAIRWAAVVVALVIVIVVLWIDIATNLWQEYVILAGLAAGVVTFVLTALLVDRVIARASHDSWAPVTRLALTDILHSLADEQESEIAHGKIEPRLLPEMVTDAEPDATRAALDILRHQVLAERKHLSRALSAWASFLAASADATDVLDHAANIAETLDIVRDVSLEVETGGSTLADLNAQIQAYNDAVRALIAELNTQIAATSRVADS